ncbi:hypothetical protein B0T20DRAFT_465123, partial [Sordaria brevicollis]
ELIITGIHPIYFFSLPLLFFFLFPFLFFKAKKHTRTSAPIDSSTESILLSQRDHRDNNSSAITTCLHTFDPTKSTFARSRVTLPAAHLLRTSGE